MKKHIEADKRGKQVSHRKSLTPQIFFTAFLLGLAALTGCAVSRHGKGALTRKLPSETRRSQQDLDGALWEAVVASNVSNASSLLASGAKIDNDKYGAQPDIHAAISSGSPDMVRFLLDHGAGVEKRDPKDGYTPLLKAVDVKHPSLEIIRLLIKYGADVHAEAGEHATAFSMARDKRQWDIVHILVTHGIDINKREANGSTELTGAAYASPPEYVRGLIANGADVNLTDSDGETPLMYAAKSGELKSLNVLLAHGANVNAKDKRGTTALMESACFATENGFICYPEIAASLVKRKAQVNARDYRGQMALMMVARVGEDDDTDKEDIKFARILLDNGARADFKNTRGQTALQIARAEHNPAIVKMLNSHARH